MISFVVVLNPYCATIVTWFTKGKTMKALVTGASRGIGEAIAKKLAKEGFDLVLTCVYNRNRLQDIANDLSSQYNISCKAVVCDASSFEQVSALFEEDSNFDVVVNNAGISHIGLLQDMSAEEWKKVIDTNLSSVFYTSKHAIPHMVSQKNGCIINVSSMWGQSGASCEVAYSASKGGVDSFTKALAKELAPSNIRVNAISLGVIDTDMNKCFSDTEREELKESIPVGRFGEAEEVADMVYSVITAPGYLTGQIIRFDGGLI